MEVIYRNVETIIIILNKYLSPSSINISDCLRKYDLTCDQRVFEHNNVNNKSFLKDNITRVRINTI